MKTALIANGTAVGCANYPGCGCGSEGNYPTCIPTGDDTATTPTTVAAGSKTVETMEHEEPERR